ncbi:MAG: hypothetical protein LUE14_08465 [Clostridiales bacterium]|nr:hypothetical protein [Clostridiales bacterium]
MIRTKKIPLLLSLFAAAILFACTYTVSLAQGTVSATIEQYYESNGGKAVFGNLETSSETYAEYEKAMIFTSSEGTFSIRLPMLNTYIAAGGYGCLGAPSGEQYIEDGMVRQDFENGSLTCEDTIITDSLCSRRGRTYYFKNTLSDGNADTVIIYGRDTDETLVGDWVCDGCDTLCVRRNGKSY